MATAAYQVEGGLDGVTNWAGFGSEPCGSALSFWKRPEELLDRAQSLGCNALRLSLEWARVEPSPGVFDRDAVRRYAQILRACRARGLEPLVTLHHFTHPRWCGEDLWLYPEAPALFERYVRWTASALTEPVRWWITINEPLALAAGTYLLRLFPGRSWGIGSTARSFDALYAAHVLAYDALHDVLDAPMVSTNTISSTAVDLDAVTVDALLGRERGVPHRDLAEYLSAARTRARRRTAAIPRRSLLAAALDPLAERLAHIGRLRPEGAALRALYASPRDRKLDFVSFDYYDPVLGNFFRPAAYVERDLRRMPGIAELWEQAASPDGFAVCLRQAHLQAPDRPILVAENGMCTAGERARGDGVTRDVYVRQMCGEVVRAREEGIDVAGYLHWTIADNYEWGSYEPRFGLFGVDRADGVRILETDATGVDAAAAYRAVIQTARGRLGGRSIGASAL